MSSNLFIFTYKKIKRGSPWLTSIVTARPVTTNYVFVAAEEQLCHHHPCPQGGSRLHKIMTVTAECFSLNQLRTNASQMNKLKAKTNPAQNRTQEEEGKEKHSQDHPGYKMLEHHHRNHNRNQPKPITNPRNHLHP